MHIEARLFEFLTAFFALCTVVYVVLNLVATMMFLLAAGLLYGASGSLNNSNLQGHQ